MKIKVNLPEDMEEFQDRLCSVMAQFLVDKYGGEKIRLALERIKLNEGKLN